MMQILFYTTGIHHDYFAPQQKQKIHQTNQTQTGHKTKTIRDEEENAIAFHR